MKPIAANAIPGFVPKGDKVGASCALCHTTTDASVYSLPGGGTIGRRQDGRSNLNLNFGKIVATADSPLAFYPFLQTASGGATIGRAPNGLTPQSSEADAKAYPSNPAYYPVGMFDDTPDGNGNPVVTAPLFRQDLAAPFGSTGEQPRMEGFSNSVYTVAFDPTSLATPNGRKFLTAVGRKAGTQLLDDYAVILRKTHVTAYPFGQAMIGYKVGDPASLVGRRVDGQKLADLRSYLESLSAPAGGEGRSRHGGARTPGVRQELHVLPQRRSEQTRQPDFGGDEPNLAWVSSHAGGSADAAPGSDPERAGNLRRQDDRGRRQPERRASRQRHPHAARSRRQTDVPSRRLGADIERSRAEPGRRCKRARNTQPGGERRLRLPGPVQTGVR